MPPVDDPVLKKLRTALDGLYGNRLGRIVLYGSRARGDANPDSDYDVAVFLHDFSDRWQEADHIAAITSNILAETGALIHAMPFRNAAWQSSIPLMHEMRREGIDL